ncbi:ROK family protein [Streptomyces sp. M10(2022)]
MGTGIGCGIVSDGRLHRGRRAVRGHRAHPGRRARRPCRCGNSGCLEAVAGVLHWRQS